MPGGDRTGPWGMGPMAGRGMGFCGTAGYANPALGRAFGPWRMGGFGGRGGRGWRHWYYATGLPGWARAGGFPFERPTPEQEADYLKAQAEQMKAALADVEKRLANLEAEQEQV